MLLPTDGEAINPKLQIELQADDNTATDTPLNRPVITPSLQIETQADSSHSIASATLDHVKLISQLPTELQANNNAATNCAAPCKSNEVNSHGKQG